MAKVTQPLSSIEARGRVGGLVYNTWRGISTVKTKTSPANQNTPRRLQIRAQTKQCTVRWQSISDAQRAAWNWWAAIHPDPHWTGNPCRKSGYNWFVRCNCRLRDMGLLIIDTPPLRPNAWPAESLDSSSTEDEITVTWNLQPGAPDTDLTLDIWLTKPLSAGRKPKIEDARHYAYVPAENGTYTTGSLAKGHYGVFCRTIDETTGLASPWTLSEVTIQAGVPASQGPNYPDTVITRGIRPDEWNNPEEAIIEDGNCANVGLFFGAKSDDLLGTDYDFTIPSGATITGIKVEAKLRAVQGSDIEVQLYRDSAVVGNADYLELNPNGLAWYSWGDSITLWGAAWTPAQINNAGFGVVFNTTPFGGATDDTYADSIRITVYYTT